MSSIIPLVSSQQSNELSSKNINAYSKFILNYLNNKFISDLLNILIYQSDLNLISNNLEIFKFLKKFIDTLILDLKQHDDLNIPKKHFFALLYLIKKIIEIKEDTSFNLLTYNNFLEHFNISDQYAVNLVEHVIQNPIKTNFEFQRLFDYTLKNIQLFNQMQVIKSTLFKWDNFISSSNSELSDLSALNWVKSFKDTIAEANNNLASVVSIKQSLTPDYLMFYDRDSNKIALDTILTFLKTSYRVYKTGYSLFDDNISGLESSSVMIIAGPSNHAKSIFMLNIMKSILELNESNEKDVYIFITLEDDINKLFRRIISIFGNYDAAIIKTLYLKISEILQSVESSNVLGQDIIDQVSTIMENITNDSILSVTQGKKRFVIKHSSENTFSVDDISKFIENFEIQGLTVRSVFVDYIDVMIPSQRSKVFNDEYTSQGQIVQEMRQCSRKYGVPIVTITQNNRTAENIQVELNNNLIGDSIKKIRYSDSIVMIRQREDLDLFNDDVSKDVDINNKISLNSSSVEYLRYATPFEAKITKAKDGEKSKTKYHIFNRKNLRITENVETYIAEIDDCETKSKDLLGLLATIGISENDIQKELYLDENDPFKNLLL